MSTNSKWYTACMCAMGLYWVCGYMLAQRISFCVCVGFVGYIFRGTVHVDSPCICILQLA